MYEYEHSSCEELAAENWIFTSCRKNYQNIAGDRSFLVPYPSLGDDKCASGGTVVRDAPGSTLANCAPGNV